MRKFLILLTSLLLCSGLYAMEPSPKARSSSSVKKERQDATRKVKQTKQRIAENQRQVSKKLNELMQVQSEIDNTQKNIASLQHKISILEKNISQVSDSIDSISHNVTVLKNSSAKSLRDARQRRQTMSAWSMILSAKSFNQAMRRTSYLHELEKSRAKSTKRLSANLVLLEAKKHRLDSLKGVQVQAIGNLKKQQANLTAQEEQMQGLVKDLKRQGGALEKELAERNRKLNQLNAELEKAIAEEQRIAQEEEKRRIEAERKRIEAERKAEEERLLALEKEKQRQAEEQAKAEKEQEKKQTKKQEDKKKTKKDNKKTNKPAEKKPAEKAPEKQSNKIAAATPSANAASTSAIQQGASFAKSKGKLLFPVSGKYSIVGQFGRNQYGDLSKVEIENPGIDILTTPGSSARAVYPGTVSSIFKIDGYHNIVMVRHGEYLTIYANISQLNVRKGDNVKTGQALGEIFTDKSDNRAVLHFEVRKEREKLNPMDWLQR